MNTKYHFGVSIEEMDPISRKVYEGLCAGISKKVLSNQYKMPISTVNAISKRFRVGLNQQTAPAIREYDATNMEQITEEKPKENNKVLKMDQLVEINNEDAKPQRKKRKTPTPEDIEMVVDLIKEGYTYDQIAELTDLSVSTVSRIKAKHASNGQTKKDTIIKSPKKEVETVECKRANVNKDIVQIANDSIRVGLVADRHVMPVNDFIFKEALSKELMFDYDKIEEICRDYIKDMIDFDNGKALQSLIVYVTGIQCASSSLIKVTNEMKVNLTFRHYDTDTKTYHTQIIWDKFSNGLLPEELGELLLNCRNSYTYKCNIEELLKNGSLVKLTEVHYDNNNSNLDYQDMYLTLDTTMAFELANKKVDEANKKNEKVSIYIKGFDLKKGRFVQNGFDLKLRTKN